MNEVYVFSIKYRYALNTQNLDLDEHSNQSMGVYRTILCIWDKYQKLTHWPISISVNPFHSDTISIWNSSFGILVGCLLKLL